MSWGKSRRLSSLTLVRHSAYNSSTFKLISKQAVDVDPTVEKSGATRKAVSYRANFDKI